MDAPVILIIPRFLLRDLWRWIAIIFGLLASAYGLFSKHMRMRNGAWRGEVVKKSWQVFLMRSWLVLIGLLIAGLAFSDTWP